MSGTTCVQFLQQRPACMGSEYVIKLALTSLSPVAGGVAQVKTHMQSMASSSETAVGHQYHHRRYEGT